MSGVRYVLTAVLPRYTMSGANWRPPATVTYGSVSETPQRVAGKYVRVVADTQRHDARVMGHGRD